LVGIAVGLSLVDEPKEASESARTPDVSWQQQLVAAACGLLASIAPDIDRIDDCFLNRFGPDGHGLSYMLYHRGHTHTVVGCLALAAVLFAFFWLPRRRYGPSPGRLAGIVLGGTLLHLFLDFSNDYGVHPWWPLSERWFYGDYLFLAEPAVGAALIPFIVGVFTRNVRLRILISTAATTAFICTLVFWKKWGVGWFPVSFTALVLIAQLLVQKGEVRPKGAWAVLLCVLGVFLGASQLAAASARRLMTEERPNECVMDVVTTPAPGNPLCFRVIVLSQVGGEFVARLGTRSLARFVDPESCFSPPHCLGPRSIVFSPVGLSEERGWSWAVSFRGTTSKFEEFAATNHRVKESRRFLRVPFWGAWKDDPDGKFIIGDLRLDYDPRNPAEYCKYPFFESNEERFDGRSVPWEPPFLRGTGER
jgi:inner membrane protein